MSTDVPSPSVLEGTDLARELGTVKQRLLALLDFSVLNETMDNGPGRDPKYPRSVMTKGLLYAIGQNKYSYDAIAQCLKTYPARRLCGFGTETPVPSTICRFWERVWEHASLAISKNPKRSLVNIHLVSCFLLVNVKTSIVVPEPVIGSCSDFTEQGLNRAGVWSATESRASI